MHDDIRSIPRPLVKTNQWVIVLSVLLTWTSGIEWLLLIPLLAGVSGLLFGFNPIMQLAKQFLKKDLKAYIPEDWEQQQFNQKIAVSCLAIGFISFLAGWNTLGYIFTILVAVAAFVAILGFCIGCYIHYQWRQYNYRRSLPKS
jgi:membrane associated rhomboid family serine protease